MDQISRPPSRRLEVVDLVLNVALLLLAVALIGLLLGVAQ